MFKLDEVTENKDILNSNHEGISLSLGPTQTMGIFGEKKEPQSEQTLKIMPIL